MMAGSNIEHITFKPIPTFRILSYKAAVRFYVGFLGFIIDWEHRDRPTDPVYMQVSCNGLLLHLTEYKKYDTNAIVFVETLNLKGFHDELKQRNSESNIQDIELSTWHTMQLKIEDPFGNVLRFNEHVINENTAIPPLQPQSGST